MRAALDNAAIFDHENPVGQAHGTEAVADENGSLPLGQYAEAGKDLVFGMGIEPTSALDAHAEHEVFTRFRVLTEGKTAVFISHRFSTVRLADRIFVIENGSVIECGSHQELLALDGRYAELFNLQAEAYR